MTAPVRTEKRIAYARAMTNLELLDRITILRDGMDADALELFHAELASRGVGPDEIGQHQREMRMKSIQHRDGRPASCQKCARAAVQSREEWHRLWGLVPLFRRQRYYCEEHGQS